jgi:hypothetical protein
VRDGEFVGELGRGRMLKRTPHPFAHEENHAR